MEFTIELQIKATAGGENYNNITIAEADTGGGGMGGRCPSLVLNKKKVQQI